jgi:hypothetical protein
MRMGGGRIIVRVSLLEMTDEDDRNGDLNYDVCQQ